ncbi:hypothetical protein NX801_11550 [Streptomyces sp. LP05-1]|uniref:Uncharacterized protein n=1 Tax=Streptomyces pyxinae TaxID=2970734 RepID=A0ABT2CFU1_9ACTN|nr:hypothetical protein [Streptomyces sp. LP05-1]MCS0636284.1 hypothetical protein [Streptomyces sp. LP05-1]
MPLSTLTDRTEREIQRHREERLADPLPVGAWIRALLATLGRRPRGRPTRGSRHPGRPG